MYGDFEEVHFVDTGDSLDNMKGYTTRGGHKMPSEFDASYQFDVFVKSLESSDKGIIRGRG